MKESKRRKRASNAAGDFMRHSAQRREIELDGDGISLGRINRHPGRVRSERLGRKLEMNGCADKRATGIPAEVDGMARVEEGREKIIAVEDLDPKIPPEDRKSTRLNSSHRCISYA